MAAPSLGLTMTAIGATVASGDTTTYQISWSCSSTVETCDTGTITVPVPTLTPYSSVATTYVAGTASTGGFSSDPTVSGGVIRWTMLDVVPAGSSGTMTFTVRVPNMASPNGATIVPVATYTTSGVTQTASSTKTVVSSPDLLTDKRLVSNQTPGLDVPVAYQVTTGHRSGINPNTGRHGNAPANGTWAIDNVVTVDRLPVGAEFVSATGGGVYDSDAHTVTWPAWSENGAFVIPPTYQVVLRYPSSVFSTASEATNTATATANPYLAPDETVNSSDDATHGFAASTARGAVTKNGSLTRANGGSRGGTTAWQIGISNSGTIPLNVDLTDALPCIWSSPTDGTTTCATPAIRNVGLTLTGGVAENPYTIDYVTNLGNTGTVTLVATPNTVTLPQQSSTEWVTSLRVRATMVGGDSASLQVSGQVSSDLPEDSSDAIYRNANVPKGSPVFLENCLSGTLTNSISGDVVQQVRDVCGYVKVDPDRPIVRVAKNMTDNVQGPGGQMGVEFVLSTQASRVNWSPVLTDLLPADLRFVPGSFTTAGLTTGAKTVLPDADLQVQVIDDYEGTGRQLVRVSWPGTGGLAPSTAWGNVKFKVAVQPGASVGQHSNELAVFDSKYSTVGCVVNTSRTDADGFVDDSQRVGCATAATYSVVSTPAVGGTKWVRGSEDADFTAAPGIGAVLPGEPATYRLDVTNLGNVPLSDVVAYDILPHVGDTGVGPASDAGRGSQWQTLLSGTVDAGGSAEIMYSLSTNPCRGEVMAVGGTRGSAPAGCVDDWSATLPSDPADVRAIRIDFGDRTFAPGEVQEVTLPVTTPADAEGIAWNSFAVSAVDDSNGNAILPVEPNVVGLRTSPSLSIDKSASTAEIGRGGEITWTIKVTNTGTGLAEGVIVVDEIQDGMDFVSADATNGAYDPETSTWALESGIPVGEDAVLTLVTRVRDDAKMAEVCNIATVSVTGTEDSVDSPNVCVTLIRGYTVSKSSDSETTMPGGVVTYTVTVTNVGAVDYTDAEPASFEDDLSGVLDDASYNGDVSAGGSVAENTLSWAGPLAVGETTTVTYSVTVKDPTTGDSVLKNVVVPSDPTGECVPGECATTTPVSSFTVAKSADAETVMAGGIVTYSVTVTNTGQVAYTDAAPASFDDDLSGVLDDATYNGDVSAGGTMTENTLTWAGPLAVGETTTVTYSVTVNDPLTGDRTLRNAVVPTGPGSSCDPDEDCVTETPVASYTVSKESDSATVLPGGVVTYTVTVTNTGEVPYTDEMPASFEDDLSGVLDDAVYNDDASNGAEVSGNTLSWSGALGVGESIEVTYSVTVDDPITGDFELLNAVAPTAPGGSCEGACTTDTPAGSYRVVKSTTATEVLPGDVVEYSITVTNIGKVAFTDDAPASFTDDLSAVLDDAVYNGDATSSTGAGVSYADPQLAWSDALDVGETVTITYSVTVNDPATGDRQLANTVVTPPGSGANCVDGSTDPACVANVPAASYTVAKSASPGTALPGDIVTYTVTVTNTGAVAYTDENPASFTDDLSRVLDDADYNGDVSVGGEVSGDTLTWNGPLEVGETIQVTYTVTVNDPVAGDFTLRNVVAPSSPGGSCVEGSCITDTPVASYTVVKTADVEDVTLGGVVIYTVTVTNTGQVPYTQDAPASIVDDLSDVLDDATYNDDATAGAQVSGTNLTWTGELGVDEVIAITYSVTVNQPATGDGNLRNSVTSDSPGGGCAADSDCIVNTPVSSYHVMKTSSASTASVGDRVTFTITVTNTGKVAYTDERPATFTDDLTSSLAVGSYNGDATEGATYDKPVLSWAGAVGVGESVDITYSVTVTSTGQLRNVVVTPDGSGANCSSDSDDPDCRTTTTVVPPGLAITGGAMWIGGGVAGAALLILGLWLVSRRRAEQAGLSSQG
ncbi:DUF7927 domain-containing protein [Microbacterium foliorum]|nr:DUF11 domain-containing protein [Microbacterium foliorum]